MACTGVIWSRYSTVIKPVGGLHIFSESKMFNHKGRFIPSKLNSRAEKFSVEPSLAVLSRSSLFKKGKKTVQKRIAKLSSPQNGKNNSRASSLYSPSQITTLMPENASASPM